MEICITCSKLEVIIKINKMRTMLLNSGRILLPAAGAGLRPVLLLHGGQEDKGVAKALWELAGTSCRDLGNAMGIDVSPWYSGYGMQKSLHPPKSPWTLPVTHFSLAKSFAL